jgi:hypothetical protein
MECCQGCQSGMGCCESSGLAGLFGLNGLMGALLAPGSQVRVGFAYESTATQSQINQGLERPVYIQDMLRNSLLEAGIFDSVSVTVTPPPVSFLTDGYILVQGITRGQQSSPDNIGQIVQSFIAQALPAISVTRRDPVVIDAVPASVQGRPDTAQPNWQQYTPQAQQQQAQAGECNWDTQSFGDYIACQLGISSPIGGVGVGAVGALLAVGLGTLVLVAVLKR